MMNVVTLFCQKSLTLPSPKERVLSAPTGLRVRTAALKSCMKNEDSVWVIK